MGRATLNEFAAVPGQPGSFGRITAVNWGYSNPNRFVTVAQAAGTARAAFVSDKWGLCRDKGGS